MHQADYSPAGTLEWRSDHIELPHSAEDQISVVSVACFIQHKSGGAPIVGILACLANPVDIPKQSHHHHHPQSPTDMLIPPSSGPMVASSMPPQPSGSTTSSAMSPLPTSGVNIVDPPRTAHPNSSSSTTQNTLHAPNPSGAPGSQAEMNPPRPTTKMPSPVLSFISAPQQMPPNVQLPQRKFSSGQRFLASDKTIVLQQSQEEKQDKKYAVLYVCGVHSTEAQPLEQVLAEDCQQIPLTFPPLILEKIEVGLH